MSFSDQAQPGIEPLRDGWFRLVGIPLVSLLSTLTFSAHIWLERPGYFPKVFLSALITAVLAWETCRRVLMRVRRRYPDLRQTSWRVILSWLGYAGVNFVITIIVYVFYFESDYWGYPIGFQGWLKSYTTAMTFTSILAGVYEAVYFFQQWQRQQREAQELKRVALECQLDALRSQLSPHFLFNSLNVLSSLVAEDFDRAEQYVSELKRVYEYVLDASGRPLVTLGEELAGLQAYFFLLKTRFGNYLHLELEVPEERYTLQLPPLTLQMLLENAIKHNVVSASKPLVVRIQSPNPDHLLVVNNLQPKNQLVPSSHVGLENIRQRYAILGRPMPELWKTTTAFWVRTSLLT